MENRIYLYVLLYVMKIKNPVIHCITGFYYFVSAPPSGLEPETL